MNEKFNPEEQHKKEWTDLRDRYKQRYETTGEEYYRHRYKACCRLLGEKEETLKYEHFK